MIDCAHMVACKSVFVFVYFSVNSCMCVWFVRPVCTRDICMYTCAYLGLLYELVLSVCECGRGRPSACQYVLMLHIWFPNFLPSLPALPSAPLHHDVRTLFCFFWVVMVVVEGGDVWWVMALNTGRQQSPSHFLCLCLSSSPSFCCSISFLFHTIYTSSYRREKRIKRSSFLCLHLSVLVPLYIVACVWAAGQPLVCRTKIMTISSSSFFSLSFSSHIFVLQHTFVIFGAVTQLEGQNNQKMETRGVEKVFYLCC